MWVHMCAGVGVQVSLRMCLWACAHVRRHVRRHVWTRVYVSVGMCALPSSVPARSRQEAHHADKAAELQKGYMENHGFGKGARDNTDPRAGAVGALAVSRAAAGHQDAPRGASSVTRGTVSPSAYTSQSSIDGEESAFSILRAKASGRVPFPLPIIFLATFPETLREQPQPPLLHEDPQACPVPSQVAMPLGRHLLQEPRRTT